jgi:predicted RNase H-like HicB family nuclease
MKKYLVVVEKTDTRLLGLFARLGWLCCHGQDSREVESQMQEAIEFHLAGMTRNGEAIPEPHTYSRYVEVCARTYGSVAKYPSQTS